MTRSSWYLGMAMGGLSLLIAAVWQSVVNGDMPLFAAPAFLGTAIIGLTIGFNWNKPA